MTEHESEVLCARVTILTRKESIRVGEDRRMRSRARQIACGKTRDSLSINEHPDPLNGRESESARGSSTYRVNAERTLYRSEPIYSVMQAYLCLVLLTARRRYSLQSTEASARVSHIKDMEEEQLTLI